MVRAEADFCGYQCRSCYVGIKQKGRSDLMYGLSFIK